MSTSLRPYYFFVFLVYSLIGSIFCESAVTTDSATDSGHLPDGDSDGAIFEDIADSSLSDSSQGLDIDFITDTGTNPDLDIHRDATPDGGPVDPETCNFDYDLTFPAPPPLSFQTSFKGSKNQETWTSQSNAPDGITYSEPVPESFHPVSILRNQGGNYALLNIVMPDSDDNMPFFDRAGEWTAQTRCYETPLEVRLLTEAESFDMYRAIAELTTGIAMDTTPEVRSVVGIRGAYPGRLLYNSNTANLYNDTLVLLWIDADQIKHVREFPVTTDPGAVDFGPDSSSFLRPNRRYHYINGQHHDYDALQINEYGYHVWDDTNNNGYWDSDRNGWLPPDSGADHDRTGSGHNIHMGSVDGPLGTATVHNHSAGCQVIPGLVNWTEFITNAWTGQGDPVAYFLVDVRDIDPRVWENGTSDGTHDFPFEIEQFPFTQTGNTALSSERKFDVYSCSDADESGPEVVYFFTVDRNGTLTVKVTDSDTVDVDIHLLEADDANACLNRDNTEFTQTIFPGRYYIIVDTYVEGGEELKGSYTLTVKFN